MTERQAIIDEVPSKYNRYLAVINDYITLNKPPLILLLLITAAGGMFLAAEGLPSLMMLGVVWIGGALASAGANALNHQIDRDIDVIMTRTSKRPVASQRISPGKALSFGVILNVMAFFWTPPHFWALSLLIQDDYEKARIPMLPVVATRDYTTLNIFLYTIVLVGITLAFAYSSSVHGIYLLSALILGGIFLGLSWKLKRSSTRKLARTVYLFSLLYLALLFVAIMVDTMVPILI